MKPEQLLYAKTHEWTSVADAGGDKIATIGISKFAVEQLTDLVFMQLPAPGRKLRKGESFGEVESVKAVSDLYSPVDGEVVEVNSGLPNKLELLGSDPYGAGWVVKIKLAPGASTSHLLSYSDYQKQCADEAH